MRIEAVISRKKLFKHTGEFKISSALWISFASVFIGIVAGSVLCCAKVTIVPSRIMQYLLSFVTDFSEKSFFEIFAGLLLTIIPYCFFVLIFSTSIMATTTIVLTNSFQSFCISYMAAYIISSYKLHGFEYYLLILLPSKIIFLFSMLLISETAIKSSNQIKQIVQKGSSDKFNTKLLLKKIGFVMLIFIFSTFVESCCASLFSSLFESLN